MNRKRDLLAVVALAVGAAFLAAGGLELLLGVGLAGVGGYAATRSARRRFGAPDQASIAAASENRPS